MPLDKTYYCSSPALDWRLSGASTVQGHLQPDPLVYSTNEQIKRLVQGIDVEHGLGIPPPRPPLLSPSMDKKTKLNQALEEVVLVKAGKSANGKGGEQVRRKACPDSPSTPPSGYKGEQGEMGKPCATPKTSNLPAGLPSTPPAPLRSPPSPSPTGKRKRVDSEQGTPSRSRGVKWAAWEDAVIVKAIIAHGEKGTDWHAVLAEINAKRDDGPRTLSGVKQHWTVQMKGKLLKVMD